MNLLARGFNRLSERQFLVIGASHKCRQLISKKLSNTYYVSSHTVDNVEFSEIQATFLPLRTYPTLWELTRYMKQKHKNILWVGLLFSTQL